MAGPLPIKGTVDPADVVEAAKLGADGLVVPNHGGRRLGAAPSTAHALPTIARALGE
jgi:L-lactate dehydrogenase (cytochrome)